MSNSKKNIVTRTRKRLKETLSTQESLNIVHDYMTSELTTPEIAEKYNTSPKNVDLIVQRHWKSLTNVRETKILTHHGQLDDNAHKNGAYIALKTIGKASHINEEFTSKLSGPDDHLLTDHELQYCYNFVATGNNLKALESAELHKGLLTAGSDKKRNQYKLACQLRGHYLRQKPNIARYITKLKEEQFIPEIIDKQFVQRELLEVLHHQKEAGEPSDKRLRTIDLIGKTVGAFSEVIKIEEVDPAKALDYIESLASADNHLLTGPEVLEIDRE